MSLTLPNIRLKLEKWEANELSHHSYQLPSGQSAVLQVSRSPVQFSGMDLHCTPDTLW